MLASKRNWFQGFHRRRLPEMPTPSAPTVQKVETPKAIATYSVVEDHRKHPLARRMGRWVIFVLVGGTVILLGACSFLIFLWVSNEASPLWKRIMISGWATRAVTLISLAIRVVAGAQAAASTSMLASLALEEGEAVLSRVAGISGIRYLNAGPLDIVVELFRGRNSQTPGRVFVLSSLLLFVTTISQFISTILLSDLKNRPVLGYPVVRQIPYRPVEIDYVSTDYYKSRPQIYASFAEYREPPATHIGEIHSTGVTLRAFLPFSDSVTRSRISHYIGKATVMDVTVTCVQPNASFSLARVDNRIDLVLTGTIKSLVNVPGTWEGRDTGPVKFTAIMALPSQYENTPGRDWATTLTVVDDAAGLKGFFGQIPDRVDAIPEYTGQLFVVVNTTGAGWWYAANATWSDGPASEDSRGEWKRYIYKPSYDFKGDSNNAINRTAPLEISLSLCYNSMGNVHTSVQVSSHKQREEPTLIWDSKTQTFDTSAIRTQLQIGSQPAAIRDASGFMNLTPTDLSWFSTSHKADYQDYGGISNIPFARLNHQNTSYRLCTSCQDYFDPGGVNGDLQLGGLSSQGFHAANIALFQDTVKATSHPAFALQALFTTVASSFYYDVIVEFSIPAAAEFSLYETVQGLGLHFAGLFTTVTILVSHLILTVTVTILFTVRSKWSLLGSSWHTVVQVACIEDQRRLDPSYLKNTLERFPASTDDEVLDGLVALGYSGRESVVLRGSGRDVRLRIR